MGPGRADNGASRSARAAMPASVGIPRVVGLAADVREEGFEGVSLVCRCPGKRRRGRRPGGVVSGVERLEGRGGRRPALRVVEALHRGIEELGVADRPAVGECQRGLAQPPRPRGVLRAGIAALGEVHLGNAPAHSAKNWSSVSASRGGRSPAGRGLTGGARSRTPAGSCWRRAPAPGRPGNSAAYISPIGAVGVAEALKLVVPDRRSEQVEVAGDVGRRGTARCRPPGLAPVRAVLTLRAGGDASGPGRPHVGSP